MVSEKYLGTGSSSRLQVSANRAVGLASWKMMRYKTIWFARGLRVYKCVYLTGQNGNSSLDGAIRELDARGRQAYGFAQR